MIFLIKERKRHIIVDTLGNLLHVMAHDANTHGTKAAPTAFERVSEKYDAITAFSGDAGYRGTAGTFVKNTLGLELHIKNP
ncbi:MAG: transposase [Gammaproteobacteria bacterium]